MEPRLDFEGLFRTHAPSVMRTLRWLGVAAADVEDVTQDVFVVVHKKLAVYDASRPFRAWLFGIVRRLASDYRRRTRRRKETSGDPTGPGLAAFNPDVAVCEARRDLDRLLDLLDEDKGVVVVLYELEGLNLAETAALAGCPLQTAHSRLQAARRRLEKGARALTQKGHQGG